MRSALLTRFCIVKHVKASPLFAQRTKRPIRILNEANKQVKKKQNKSIFIVDVFNLPPNSLNGEEQ